jgi:hypothetical protein
MSAAFLKKLLRSPATRIKTIRRKCLRVWGEIIRGRAGSKCQRCGRLGSLDAHHIIPRGTGATMGWFDLNNGIALCFQCHRVHGAHSIDVDEQLCFREWVKGWLAAKDIDYDILKIRCKAGGKISEFDYSVLLALLKKDLAALGGA